MLRVFADSAKFTFRTKFTVSGHVARVVPVATLPALGRLRIHPEHAISAARNGDI
jgi:hypothetical protein